MITEKDVVLHYQYFFRKRYSSKVYRFLLNDSKKQQLTTKFVQLFNEEFKESAGRQVMWNYFLFQFGRWEGAILQENKIGGGKILPAMIIGQKAFTTFLKRDQTFDWIFYRATTFTEKYKIRQTEIYPQDQKKEAKVKFISILQHIKNNDPNKAAFLNTEEGMATCVEMTALYDPLDTSCAKCKFASECIELLKQYYPKIYNQQNGQR